jgi:hypothetical protein
VTLVIFKFIFVDYIWIWFGPFREYNLYTLQTIKKKNLVSIALFCLWEWLYPMHRNWAIWCLIFYCVFFPLLCIISQLMKPKRKNELKCFENNYFYSDLLIFQFIKINFIFPHGLRRRLIIINGGENFVPISW